MFRPDLTIQRPALQALLYLGSGANDTPAAGMTHTQRHRHESLQHAHPHLPDLHHRHSDDT
jgi:hypothetical protein